MSNRYRDFTKLFRSESDSFLSELNLTQEEKDIIKRAKEDIRDILKIGLRAFALAKGVVVEPRFLSQGSAVYKTQNRPNHVPPQQVDHDYGCYLPFSFVEGNGTPKIAAKEYFAEVDVLLARLVKEKWYKGVVKTKGTCSRLVVNDRIHIDVPLYSVPDKELQTITEAAKMQGYDIDSVAFGEQYFDPDMKWPFFASDQVLLAHRTEGWKKSDPRKLNLHFTGLLKIDEQLRRICRYLKAFRDEQWKEGGPSSISIMILVSEAKAMIPTGMELEQDALLFVLERIAELIHSDILNPTERTEKISISPEDRERFAELCRNFAQDLRDVIHDETIPDPAACDRVRAHLGNRFPRHAEVSRKETIREAVLSKAPIHVKREPPARTMAG